MSPMIYIISIHILNKSPKSHHKVVCIEVVYWSIIQIINIIPIHILNTYSSFKFLIGVFHRNLHVFALRTRRSKRVADSASAPNYTPWSVGDLEQTYHRGGKIAPETAKHWGIFLSSGQTHLGIYCIQFPKNWMKENSENPMESKAKMICLLHQILKPIQWCTSSGTWGWFELNLVSHWEWYCVSMCLPIFFTSMLQISGKIECVYHITLYTYVTHVRICIYMYT